MLFGGDSGADAGDADVEPTPGPTPTPTPGEPTPEPTDPSRAARPTTTRRPCRTRSRRCSTARPPSRPATWTAFGEADERLTAAVEKLIELGEQ